MEGKVCYGHQKNMEGLLAKLLVRFSRVRYSVSQELKMNFENTKILTKTGDELQHKYRRIRHTASRYVEIFRTRNKNREI